MAEIVNLRRVRKAKARAEKENEAAAARALHGTAKRLKDEAAAQSAKARERLEGHALGSSGKDGKTPKK